MKVTRNPASTRAETKNNLGKITAPGRQTAKRRIEGKPKRTTAQSITARIHTEDILKPVSHGIVDFDADIIPIYANTPKTNGSGAQPFAQREEMLPQLLKSPRNR